ncbi:MAG: DUF2784 family protein [Leptospira sp.]|nr:DUF2784 family protein [Leptospira sp.]
MIFLNLANLFFFVFHGLIIFINLFVWMIPKLHKIHYIVLCATLFSWLVMGYFYGWGYCFLTDWHYGVLRELGYTNLPYSYIKFCLDGILGTDLDPVLVDVGTVTGLLFGVGGAGYNLVKGKI